MTAILIVLAFAIAAIFAWLWFSAPDDEALEEQLRSAKPYDTSIPHQDEE